MLYNLLGRLSWEGNMTKNVTMIFDIPIYSHTLAGTTDLIYSWICAGKKHMHVVTANSEIIYNTRRDQELRQVLQKAALVTADGIGVIWASRILGDPLPERVTGIDLMDCLLTKLSEGKRSVFLLGAKPEVIRITAAKFAEQYPDLIIRGYHDGYFKTDEPIIDLIKEAQPDVLLVCLGSPRQDFWLAEHLPNLPVGVAIGLGGCFDVVAGTVKRAPLIWQKIGMEWAYRLIQEPSRIKRMSALPKFAATVWRERLFK